MDKSATIEMEWTVKMESDDLSQFDKLILMQNERLRKEKDLALNQLRFHKAKFQYYAAYYNVACQCLYCGKKLYRSQSADHALKCKDHPIHEERMRIHKHYEKQIMERDAKIKHQRMTIKNFEKKLKKKEQSQ